MFLRIALPLEDLRIISGRNSHISSEGISCYRLYNNGGFDIDTLGNCNKY